MVPEGMETLATGLSSRPLATYIRHPKQLLHDSQGNNKAGLWTMVAGISMKLIPSGNHMDVILLYI